MHMVRRREKERARSGGGGRGARGDGGDGGRMEVDERMRRGEKGWRENGRVEEGWREGGGRVEEGWRKGGREGRLDGWMKKKVTYVSLSFT